MLLNSLNTRHAYNSMLTYSVASTPCSSSSGVAVGVAVGVVVVILLITIAVISAVIILKRQSIIIIFKRKFKQTSASDTPTVDEGGMMQENESYISTPHIPVTTNEAYATTVPLSPNQEYDIQNYATIDTKGNAQNIETEKNDVSVATPHIPVTTNESYATTAALTPNQAYGSTNTKKQPAAIDETEDSYDYI